MSGLGAFFIDDVLTFAVNTHNPSTGAASDADSAPTYRVYEEETATPILTGTMALLDSTNTTGFYSEAITLSAANGFEVGKSYNIYIEAAVSSVTGTTSLHFKMANNAYAAIASDTRAEPGQGAPAATTTLAEKIDYLYKSWRNKKDNDGSTTQLYADDGTTVDQKQSTSSAGGTVTKDEWITGP